MFSQVNLKFRSEAGCAIDESNELVKFASIDEVTAFNRFVDEQMYPLDTAPKPVGVRHGNTMSPKYARGSKIKFRFYGTRAGMKDQVRGFMDNENDVVCVDGPFGYEVISRARYEELIGKGYDADDIYLQAQKDQQ